MNTWQSQRALLLHVNPTSSICDVFSFGLFRNVYYAIQLVLNVLESRNHDFRLLQVQPPSIIGVELLDCDALSVALLEILVVIQVAVVGRDSVEVAHVLGLCAFFLGEEGFVHLLAVADADDLDVFLLAAEEFADGLGLGLDGAGRGFLDEDVAVLPMLEREEHEVDGLIQAHYEAGHRRFGEGDGLAGTNLVDPEGNDAATRAHYVAVARAADLGVPGIPTLGNGYFLLEGLADAHRIDGICGFVGREADDALDASIDGGVKGVVRADDICLHGLHREEFTAGDLLKGRCVEHVVDTLHRILQRALVANVSDIELNLICDIGILGLILVTHVVLLLFVTGEDADLANIRAKKALEDSITKGPCSSSNHKGFVFENRHIIVWFSYLIPG